METTELRLCPSAQAPSGARKQRALRGTGWLG